MDTPPFNPDAPPPENPPGGFPPPPPGGYPPPPPPGGYPPPPPGGFPPPGAPDAAARQTNSALTVVGVVGLLVVVLCLCVVGGGFLMFWEINQQTNAIFSSIASALEVSPAPYTPGP